MNNYNNINITPNLIRMILWGICAVAIFSIGMAFIRPWYNVWSQEMEGKAEFAKAEQMGSFARLFGATAAQY